MATTPYPFVAGAVLTASQLNSTFNVPINAQTASYVLVASDAGKRVQMSNAGATTITVNTSLFSAGDSLFIQNIGAGTCTITAGTATVTTAGSLALAQWGGGTLYFTSASAAVFFSGGGVPSGVATGGSSSSITVSGQNYTLLTFTSDSTLTVTKSGLFDFLIISGGGGGGKDGTGSTGHRGGGGGGGGVLQLTNIYLSANQTVTVGAGGAAGATSAANGTPGAVSRVGDFYSLGGGGGAFSSGIDPAPTNAAGGSLGGGTKNTSFDSITQGNKGGISAAVTNGAGGGGKGAVGADGSGTTGGNGGAGTDVSTFIAGSALFKAAGGGGAGSSTGGTGGSSIGGTGSTSAVNATGAAANTASGGGGAGDGRTAGAGGSGIVYVRFKV